MLPHFSGNMRQDFVAVFHADLESRVGKAIHDYTFHDHGIRNFLAMAISFARAMERPGRESPPETAPSVA
jgi:hypothetical protein